MTFAQPQPEPSVDLEAWFDSEPPREPGGPMVCTRHALTLESICGRCGIFCCEACVDSKHRSLCDSCGAMASTERTRAAVNGVAWKLALAPAFVVVSAASLALRHHDVPVAFVAFTVPLLSVWGLLRTRRPGFAWLGTLSSLALLGWVLWGLFDAGEWGRLADVGLLAIAPVVAVKECLELSRSRGIERLRETMAVVEAAS